MYVIFKFIKLNVNSNFSTEYVITQLSKFMVSTNFVCEKNSEIQAVVQAFQHFSCQLSGFENVLSTAKDRTGWKQVVH